MRVRKGSYWVERVFVTRVETPADGVNANFDGGPGRAISQFLSETAGRYEIDASYCDQFGHNVTGNPNGYLRRMEKNN